MALHRVHFSLKHNQTVRGKIFNMTISSFIDHNCKEAKEREARLLAEIDTEDQTQIRKGKE